MFKHRQLLLVITTLFCLSSISNAQKWAFHSGSNYDNSNPPIYGEMGVSNELNSPGGRFGFATWTDSQGNNYLFGGRGKDSDGTIGFRNDLWRYDGQTWTWISGDSTLDSGGDHGALGVAHPDNIPSGRVDAVSWTDADGNFWLFGGQGKNSAGVTGEWNDLWKFDGQNWTWVKGLNNIHSLGQFGTEGVADADNVPSARRGASIVQVSNGDVLLFGGEGRDGSGNGGYLNDLWRWNGTAWTWLDGSNIASNFGVYGIQGQANVSNVPGARYGATFWVDSQDNFYIYGGFGFAENSGFAYLNDLWKWDGSNWTWVSGLKDGSQTGIYGDIGQESTINMPGSRAGAIGWTDANDNLYLFSGFGFDKDRGPIRLNDLWKWDGATWKWISGSDVGDGKGSFGIKDTPQESNSPDARFGSGIWLNGEVVNLYGGDGCQADFWQWDGTNWIWKSGQPSVEKEGNYGTIGIANASNHPGIRMGAVTWEVNGDLYLFGGQGRGEGNSEVFLNDLWKYDGSNWTWLSGTSTSDDLGNYGEKGVAAESNLPRSRSLASSWKTSNGDLYLYGGFTRDGESFVSLNDLWKWDGQNWTWLSGDKTSNQLAYYGEKGVAAPSNDPGSRYGAVQWKDASGNLFLFGGLIAFESGGVGEMADLWKWDGQNWTWVDGPSSFFEQQYGIYGEKGVTSESSIPGPRYYATVFQSAQNEVYLFGGYGYDANGESSYLNDLWKWDGANWTWLAGSTNREAVGNYGEKGVPDTKNAPSARQLAAGWVTNSGNLYVFGGNGLDARSGQGLLNDLWRWDGEAWTWLKGADTIDSVGILGERGVQASENEPSARVGASSWIGANGTFYLFGGIGKDQNGRSNELNDLWKIEKEQQGLSYNNIADIANKVYGDQPFEVIVTASSGEVVQLSSSDPNIVSFDGSTATINGAGQADIIAIEDRADFYQSIQGATLMSVGKADIAISAEEQSKIYGENDPELTWFVSEGQLVGADDLSGNLLRAEGESAGAYAIEQGSLTAGVNYNLTFKGADLSIFVREITVKIDDLTKNYGEQDPELTFTITDGSLAFDDQFEGELSRDPGENVGEYEIDDNTLRLSENYTLFFNTGILSIEPAVLTVTADDAIINKGDDIPALTIQYEGFVNGEDVSVLSQAPEVNTSATATSDRGTYAIEVTGGEADNYEFANINGTLTITGPVYSLPSTIAFNNVVIGDTQSEEVTIENMGDGALNVTGIALPAGYSVDQAAFDVNAGSNGAFTVTFTPTVEQVYSGDITITSNNGEESIAISGEGKVVAAIDDDQLDIAEVKVYPNPSNEWLSIDLTDSPANKANLSLIDTQGSISWQLTEETEKQVSVNVSSFSSGMYLLIVATEKGTVIKKVMVKH